MIHFIYKTTCIENGKYYIGMHSTECLEDGYLGSGTILKKAVAKYGSDSFEREILSYHDTREDVVAAENKILKSISISDKFCYNIIKGGKNYRGNHEEDVQVFRTNFERFSDKYYHFEVTGELYKKRLFDNNILNTIYKVFEVCNERIADDLNSLFNDKKKNRLAVEVISRIKETADFPDNLVVTEMDWECAINSIK